MAWPDVTIQMLRIFINDVDSTLYAFSDDRLQETLVVSAQLVNQEIDFSQTYTINITAATISPDFTLTATKDDPFTNFIVLKAACIMDQSLFRTKALVAGLKAKCGPVVLETIGHLAGFKELINFGPCAAYVKLKEEWIFGNAQVVEAVLSPFVSNNFDPQSLAVSRGLSGSVSRNRFSLY